MRVTIIFLGALLMPFGNLALAQAGKAPADALKAAGTVQSAAGTPGVSKAVAIVELEVVTVLALSQADGRAVLALPGKQMVVVKSGDPVPRTRAVLKQVLGDKLVLEEKSADGKSRQLVWMHKGQGATPGRLDRFAADAAPTVITPPPLRSRTPVKVTPATP